MPEPQLPEFGMPLGRQIVFGSSEEALDIFRIEQLALPSAGIAQHVADEFQKRPAQIFQGGDREVPFGRSITSEGTRARRLLEDVLSATAELQCSRNAGGKLNEFMIEKRDAPLQASSHRHVVNAFDGVVDQHDLRIKLQGLVDWAVSVALAKKTFNKVAAGWHFMSRS